MRTTHFTANAENAQHALRATHIPPKIGGMKTGERIRRLRKDLGLTLEEVEQRAGLPPGNLSRIERSLQWISEETLLALAAALSVHPGAFFGDEPSGAAPTRPGKMDLAQAKAGASSFDQDDLIELIVTYCQSTPEGQRFIMNSTRATRHQGGIRWARDEGGNKG